MAIADLAKWVWEFELLWLLNALGWFVALNWPRVNGMLGELRKARF